MSNQESLDIGEKTVTRKKDQIKQRNQSYKRQIIQRIVDNLKKYPLGLPWWHSSWESAYQCRGRGFEPWSGRIPRAAKQLGLCATAAEPAVWSPRAWGPCSTAGGVITMRSPRTATKSSPRPLQLEKARVQQQGPNAAKNK